MRGWSQLEKEYDYIFVINVVIQLAPLLLHFDVVT